jgi:hydrogenase nickel incorporation protein HypA/HybF
VHELSLAAYLLEAVCRQAEQSEAERVIVINLLVGERSGVVEDSLRFCFDLLAPETVAAGAELHVRQTPMRFSCAGCAADYSPAQDSFACPGCGQYGQVQDDGTDLVIESLEVQP